MLGLVADAQQADGVAQLGGRLDLLVVDLGDDVARDDAGLVGGGALGDAGYHRAALLALIDVEGLGQLRPEVAHQTNLAVQTVVINGGQDHACEGLALGATAPGSLWLACGTAWVLNGAVDTPDVDEIPETMSLNPHVVPGRWSR